MLTNLQKKSVQAIVNIFETGRALGDYGQVTLLAGDSGHLTYGRSQTTLASGNLFLLVKAYCEAPGALFGPQLSAFLDRLEDMDLALDHDMTLRGLLREAGDDPVMQIVQDGFFDRVYWEPAVKSAKFIGSETALGMAAVYDSRIHGSWHRMRDRTNENHGTLAAIGEKAWIPHYLAVRRDWLANHSNKLLGKTVYRMDSLKQLTDANSWDLDLPFTVRGNVIDESVLSGDTLRASAAVAEERTLRLRNPFMQGEDVRQVQKALFENDIMVDVDGVFGPGTKAGVVTFQEKEGLTPDGIVGPSTRSRLEIDD
jgi:chitosanase